MLYRKMPKTGDSLSILGFGCMRLPGGQMRLDEKRSIAQIRSAIDQGVNYIDTAWTYHGGKSEVIVAKALGEGYREKVKVADKLPFWLCNSRGDMDYYLDKQLERLGMKTIDYYLIHSLEGATWRRMKEMGVADFLEGAKKQGKILHAGFSFHGPRDDFKEIIDGYDWEFSQIQFNILDEHDQAGIEGLNYAASKNIGLIVMEPLRGGTLAAPLPPEVQKVYDSAPVKRSNAEWALRWIWNHEGVVTVLSGMNEESQIAENIRIASDAGIGSLKAEELAVVKKVADAFRKIMKVPCTGCQYCMPCPNGVNIPLCFSVYNNKYLFRQGLMSKMMYIMHMGGTLGRDPSLASLCEDCGVCMENCPQKINISSELVKVSNEFEGPMTKPLIFIIGKLMSMGSRKKSNPPTAGTK